MATITAVHPPIHLVHISATWSQDGFPDVFSEQRGALKKTQCSTELMTNSLLGCVTSKLIEKTPQITQHCPPSPIILLRDYVRTESVLGLSRATAWEVDAKAHGDQLITRSFMTPSGCDVYTTNPHWLQRRGHQIDIWIRAVQCGPKVISPHISGER